MAAADDEWIEIEEEEATKIMTNKTRKAVADALMINCTMLFLVFVLLCEEKGSSSGVLIKRWKGGYFALVGSQEEIIEPPTLNIFWMDI